MKKILALLVIIISPTIFATSEIGIDSLLADHLADRGILKKQISLEQYNTQANITRAELVGIALKIKKVQLPENYVCKKYFSDVTKNDWICRAVELAADEGLITRKNKNFRPQDNILNIEAMSILHKASGLTDNKPSQAMTDFISSEVKIGWHKKTLSEIDKSGIVFNAYPVYNVGYPIVDIKRSEAFDFINNILNIQDSKKGITVPIISFGERYYDRTLTLKTGTTNIDVEKEGSASFAFIKNNVLFYEWSSTGGTLNKIYNLDTKESRSFGSGNVSADGKYIFGCEQENVFTAYSIEKKQNLYRTRDAYKPNMSGMVPEVVCTYKRDQGGTLVFPDRRKYILEREFKDPINVLDTYYTGLNLDLEQSYKMRTNSSVSLETFESWYNDTGELFYRIDPKTITNLGDQTYEFMVLEKEVIWPEGNEVLKNRYLVKSKVDLENFKINNLSSVKQ